MLVLTASSLKPAGHSVRTFQLRSSGITVRDAVDEAGSRQNTGVSPSRRQAVPAWLASMTQGDGSLRRVGALRVVPTSPVRAFASVMKPDPTLLLRLVPPDI